MKSSVGFVVLHKFQVLLERQREWRACLGCCDSGTGSDQVGRVFLVFSVCRTGVAKLFIGQNDSLTKKLMLKMTVPLLL
jgi:hypothetical protein